MVDPGDLQHDGLPVLSERVKTSEDFERRESLLYLPVDEADESFSSPSTLSSSSKRKSEDAGSSSDEELEHFLKRVKRSASPSNRFTLPGPRDNFLSFCTRPRTAFVNKTRALFQLPKQFRCLLLRPPRFGKSAFLSAMSQFYDIQGAGTFQQYFGTPEAANDPLAPHHSQHLCLGFSLRSVDTRTHFDDFLDQLKWCIFSSLKSFLKKYARELELSTPLTYLAYEDNEPLEKVFNLVKSYRKTLFVGVDAYDAPLLESMFSPALDPELYETFVTTDDVAQQFSHYLWKPLQMASEVISKLFVTGTLAFEIPALQDLVVPAPSSLESCCGFTEDEAVQFTQSILPEQTVDMNDLRGRCGDYPADDQPLLHPQILIDHISKWTWEPSEGHPFRLLSSLFDLLPAESDVPNVVTLNGLVELIASGGMQIEPAELNSGRDFDGTSVSWSALHHAGALTHVRGSKSTFRVANSQVLSMIHSRIDHLVRERYWVHLSRGKRINFLNALVDYDSHNHQPLMDALSHVLRDLAQPFLRKGTHTEPTLLGVLELIMRNYCLIGCPSSELLEPILTDPTNSSLVRVYGFSSSHIYRWEVTTLTLRGIWLAAHPNDSEPSVEALRQLHDELCQEEEEKLLQRRCNIWSDSLQAMESHLIGSFFKPDAEFAQLIAVGGARILRRAGLAELAPIPPVEADQDAEREEGDHGEEYLDQEYCVEDVFSFL